MVKFDNGSGRPRAHYFKTNKIIPPINNSVAVTHDCRRNGIRTGGKRIIYTESHAYDITLINIIQTRVC